MTITNRIRRAMATSPVLRKLIHRRHPPVPVVPPLACPYPHAVFAYYSDLHDTDNTTAREHACLFTLAALGRGNIIELGTYIGKSTCVMASAIRSNTGRLLYTIDLFSRGRGDTVSREKHLFQSRSQHDIVTKSIADLSLADRVRIITGCTWDAALSVPGSESATLLFIDASHHYEDVQRDILAYIPHVACGGYVAFHDYNCSGWPGVRQAVDEFLASRGDFRACFLVDSMLVVQKT